MTWKQITRRTFTASGAADWQGPWLQCSPGSVLVFQTTWTADAGTAGVLGFDMTADPAQDAASVIALVLTDGFYGLWPNVGAVAGTALAFVKTPAPFMRPTFVGGGGVADQFTAWLELRS